MHTTLVGGCIEKEPSVNNAYVTFIPVSSPSGALTGGGGKLRRLKRLPDHEIRLIIYNLLKQRSILKKKKSLKRKTLVIMIIFYIYLN